MFRNLYLEKSGKKFDAVRNGGLSCAYFVSNVLLIWGLVSSGHATVEGTTKDMEKNGWKRVSQDEVRLGDVIVWGKTKAINGKIHFHNGFYIGNKKAISNDSKKGIPIVHHWTYNNKRKIIAIYSYHEFVKNA